MRNNQYRKNKKKIINSCIYDKICDKIKKILEFEMPINASQSEIYESFTMYSPSGDFMCYCNKKKADLYIKKNLAEWIDDKKFKLIFDRWKIFGISVIDFANPLAFTLGNDVVSLPVYKSSLKYVETKPSKRSRSCSVTLFPRYKCAIAALSL